MRILEIGCGPGVAAREIVRRFDNCYVLGVDRSLKAIEQAKKSSTSEMTAGKLKFVHSAIENLTLPGKEGLFDLAFAIRVGALDGRHPKLEQKAVVHIKQLLRPGGLLFIDGGDPVKQIFI